MGRLTLEYRILCNLLHQQGTTTSVIALRLATTRKEVTLHFTLFFNSLNILKINLKFKHPFLHRKTVRKAIHRNQMTGSYKDVQRPGRTRMSTHRKVRLLVRQSQQNTRETVPHLRIGWIQNGVQASNSTV